LGCVKIIKSVFIVKRMKLFLYLRMPEARAFSIIRLKIYSKIRHVSDNKLNFVMEGMGNRGEKEDKKIYAGLYTGTSGLSIFADQ